MPLDSFAPREVAVKGWTGLDTSESARKAADLLVDYGWLRKDLTPSGATGGRPSERYAINPAAMKGGVK
jgi:putative DNA primase/helicase